MLRDTVLQEELRERVEHIVSGESACDPKRHAFPGVFVDHGEDAKPPAVMGRLGDEVVGPTWLRLWGRSRMQEPEAAIKEPVIAPGASPEAAADLGARFVREGRAAATRGSIVILTPFRVLPGGGCDLRRDDSFAGVTMQGRDD